MSDSGSVSVSSPPGEGVGGWRAELRPSRILFGAGRLQDLGELVRELGGGRVLVVTDEGIRRAGHVDRALGSLAEAEIPAYVFDRVEENPEEKHVAAGVEEAKRHGIDFLVGLGGGSAMDCAKGVNFVFTNGGRMEDYWGLNKATKPMLPSVGVPCTAGTGSEAQSYALISRPADHRKMACGDEKARFRAVVLDPELALTAPADVVATSGLDALSHALESYVTRVRNPLSQMFAVEAWRRLESRYAEVVAGAGSIEAWGEMLLGAHFAGAAIETSMLGAAHACANPLTARYGIVHGVAVGLLLPHTIRFNGEGSVDPYRGLEREGPADSASRRLAARVEELRGAAGLPERLRDVGVEAESLPQLAVQAAEQWTAGFNPRPVGARDLEALYRAAY